MKVGIIPAQTSLGGNGCMNGVDDCTRYFEHFRHIAKETSSCSFACYFLDRTAEIDVDEVGFGLLNDEGSVTHRLGFTTVDLYSHRSFGIEAMSRTSASALTNSV